MLWCCQVENHEDFGQGVVREKRVVELLDKRIWDWCGLCVFFIVFALLGIITVFLVEYTSNAISETIEGVVALAASVVGALVLTIVKFLLQVRARGVFDTAQGVLRKAYVDGKKSVGDGRLGFMSEVKEELRATHLLLQQPEAQMVVFLAVDPRIIVSAIDKKLEDVPDEVNGLVYLEKIIHIPFCLPQISKEDQRNYLQGLLSEEPPAAPSSSPPSRPEGAASTSSSTDAAPTTVAPVTGPEPPSAPISTVPSTGTGASPRTPEVRETRETRRALTAAERTVFTAVLEKIKATPRKIKRAVNVYVLQRSLAKLNGLDDDKLPALVKWSILSEFWPCRVSGIASAAQNGLEVDDITTAYDVGVRGNQDKEKLKPLYLIDGPEGSFLDALRVKDTPTISSVQVLEFLPYSVGLNPAIVSAVEADMREAPAPVVEARTREAGVEEAKTGGSAE
ncbi:unnamed protein product [Ectocarpus sp. CCAP 1310/34]|nr:unnamed protein product [Ectocarpus sp. CCAP 1310/34]